MQQYVKAHPSISQIEPLENDQNSISETSISIYRSVKGWQRKCNYCGNFNGNEVDESENDI